MLLRSLFVAAALAALAAAPASAAIHARRPEAVLRRGAGGPARTRRSSTAAGSRPTRRWRSTSTRSRRSRSRPITNLDGTLRGTVRAPFIEEGERAFSLRVTERDNVAQQRHEVLARDAALGRADAGTGGRRASACASAGAASPSLSLPVYAHYVFAGKSQKTVRLGVPTGPCGTVLDQTAAVPVQEQPAPGRLDDPVRPGDAPTTRRPRSTTGSPSASARRVKPQRARAR